MIKYTIAKYDIDELPYIVSVKECTMAVEVLTLAKGVFGSNLNRDVACAGLFIRFVSGAVICNVNGIYKTYANPYDSSIKFIKLDFCGNHYVYGDYAVTCYGEVVEA